MKQRMMSKQRDYMFYIKYQRNVVPSEDDDDEMIVEVLPVEIRRGDGTPLNVPDYNIRVNN